jgi:hypothetical protein
MGIPLTEEIKQLLDKARYAKLPFEHTPPK